LGGEKGEDLFWNDEKKNIMREEKVSVALFRFELCQCQKWPKVAGHVEKRRERRKKGRTTTRALVLTVSHASYAGGWLAPMTPGPDKGGRFGRIIRHDRSIESRINYDQDSNILISV
jgi:hypothetical protein